MCIFTYGQTNSGKTFTMKGPPGDKGLVLRSLEGLFTKLAPTLKCYFEINISYFEIYNEEVYDLLDPTANSEPLKVQYDKDKGVEIKGLTKKFVYSFSEAEKCYESGENKRKFAVTNMNHNSSRSHVLLQIGVRTKFTAHPNRSNTAVLLMADLAGSESMETAGTSGQTQREGSLINKSLLALTTIITRLKSTQKKSGPLSYRDSKLTRVLQPVLTENSNTMVICTVSRDAAYITESMNTLRFGDCANKVKLRMRPVDVERLTLTATDKKGSPDEGEAEQQQLTYRNAGASAEELQEENFLLREALEKKEIELEHQISMFELQVEKTAVVEHALAQKESEILRLREDNKHMQRLMEIQEKSIVLSLEHSIKKRLLFEVRATYESEIGRLKTELIEAIEASTIPLEDKAVKKKLKILHERLACGEKESRELKAKLLNKDEEIRKMREELDSFREERQIKRMVRPMPFVSAMSTTKKNTNQKLESSIERGPPQNSISREASKNRHRICCTPQTIAMIPTLRLGRIEESEKIDGARIFNHDGELSKVVEKSIKKSVEQTTFSWAGRNGTTFSFGAPFSNKKQNQPDGQEPLYSYQRKEEPIQEPEVARHLFFDNVSRSPIKNASSSGFLDSFIWGGKGSATEPQTTGHPNFFSSMIPESSNSSSSTHFKPALLQNEEFIDQRNQQQPIPKNTIVPEQQNTELSLNERIELLRRPLH